MTIWLIRGRAEAFASSPTITKSELRTYLRLRADLEWLLGFLGAVIGLYWPARSFNTSSPSTRRPILALRALSSMAWSCHSWLRSST